MKRAAKRPYVSKRARELQTLNDARRGRKPLVTVVLKEGLLASTNTCFEEKPLAEETRSVNPVNLDQDMEDWGRKIEQRFLEANLAIEKMVLKAKRGKER